MELTVDYLNTCHGKEFTAIIDKRISKGKIVVENQKVFLVQNNSGGTNCKEKLGYKYSWVIIEYDQFIGSFKEQVQDLIILDSISSESKLINEYQIY